MYGETLSEFLEFVREAKGNIQNSFKIITNSFFVENFLQKDNKFGIIQTGICLCTSHVSLTIAIFQQFDVHFNSFGIELDACSICKIFCRNAIGRCAPHLHD